MREAQIEVHPHYLAVRGSMWESVAANRRRATACGPFFQSAFLARKVPEVGGWTETRPVSLGLLPSGPDPVGEWNVHRQPPARYVDHRGDARNGKVTAVSAARAGR